MPSRCLPLLRFRPGWFPDLDFDPVWFRASAVGLWGFGLRHVVNVWKKSLSEGIRIHARPFYILRQGLAGAELEQVEDQRRTVTYWSCLIALLSKVN